MMILANAELILPDRVMRGAIHVEDGVIVAISEGAAVPPVAGSTTTMQFQVLAV